MQVKEILRVKGNRLLSIEPTGRALVESLFPAHSARVTAAFGNLDETEKRTFSELCRKLAA